MFFKNFINLIFLFFIIGCANNSNQQKSTLENEVIKNVSVTPELQYIKAMDYFNNQKIEESVTIFQNITKIYPLSNEAIQSQIMLGFIDYTRMDYDSAIFKFTAGFNDICSNVLIKFSFHSSRISCQIPRPIVRVIQNKEKTKNL